MSRYNFKVPKALEIIMNSPKVQTYKQSVVFFFEYQDSFVREVSNTSLETHENQTERYFWAYNIEDTIKQLQLQLKKIDKIEKLNISIERNISIITLNQKKLKKQIDYRF
ncbi:Hypothetical_protein [Hexamita inflata]|uniref:Hypothetical_protein n=1 Tax=Hexamita inflata TaxID=28002 RepID=A0AA86T9I5_9EUKA|nr:Hypothetical protein HINF_LOCUS674 [Hexamita inflata]